MYSALWKKNGEQIHPSFMSVNARVVDLAAQLVFTKTYTNIGKAFAAGQPDEATFKAHLNTSLGVLTGFEIKLDGKKLSAEVTNLDEALKQLGNHTAEKIAREAPTQDPYLEEDFFLCRLSNLVQYQELEVIITYVTEMSMQGEYLYMVFPTSLSTATVENNNIVNNLNNNNNNNSSTKSEQTKPIQNNNILNNSNSNSNSIQGKQGLKVKLDLEMPSSIIEIKSPSHPDGIISKIGKESNTGSVEYEDSNPLDESNQNDLTILVKLKDPHEPAGFVERSEDGSNALMLVFYPRLSNNNNSSSNNNSESTKTIDTNTTSFAAAVAAGTTSSGSSTPQKSNPTQEMELIFLVDCSESMEGYNLNHAKKGLHLFSHSLNKTIYFNIISFGSGFRKLFPQSMQYGEKNLESATQFIKSLKAETGETNLLAPLKDIFSAPASRPRKIFILTDGGVANVGQIVELVRQNADNTSVFPIGMGEFGSRQLVDVVANAGCGVAELAIENETIENKVMRQLKRALQPAYTNIRIDWGTMSSSKQAPRDLRTLFDGDRLTVFNILDKGEKVNGTVTLHANGPSGPVSFQIQIHGDEVKQGDMIHCLAAYTLISDLQYQLLDITDTAEANRLTKRIVDLGIKYGLPTNYTSFFSVPEDNKESQSAAHHIFPESAKMISLRGSASGIPTNLNHHHPAGSNNQTSAPTISSLKPLSSNSPPFTPSISNLSPAAAPFTPSTPLSKSTLKFNSPEFVPKSFQPSGTIPFGIAPKITPVATTPTPAATTPAPAVATSTPAPATTTPTQAPAAATPTPAPATTTPTPATTTPAPVAATPTPAPATATPTPAPATTTPAPATATPTPAPATTAAETTTSTTPTQSSPSKETPAPAATAATPSQPLKPVTPVATVDPQANKIAAAISAGLSQLGMTTPTTVTNAAAAASANAVASNAISPTSSKKQYSIQFLLGQRFIDSNTRIPETLKSYSSLLHQHQKPGAIFGGKENRRGKDRHHGNFDKPSHPPPAPATKRITSKDTEGVYSETYKKFKFNLNRITMDTYSTLIKQIEEITIPNEDALKGIAKILFEKAIIDQKYSAVYAIMTGHLDVKYPKFENNITLKREVILNCQSCFEEKPDRSKFEQLTKEDLEEQEFIIKRRTLGNIKFIGELYKHSVLAESIVIQCIRYLLGKAQENTSEDLVEAVVKLITTIGKKLDADPNKPAIANTFYQLHQISENEKFTSRARYLILGLLDLRAERWEPKTTGMLKVNKEDHEKEERFIKQYGGRRGDDERGGDRRDDRERGDRRDRRDRDRRDRDRDSTPRKGIFGKGSKDKDSGKDGWEIAGSSKASPKGGKQTPKKNELNSSSSSTPVKAGVTSPLRTSTSGTNKKDANQRQNMFSVLEDDDFPHGSPKKESNVEQLTTPPAKLDTNVPEISLEKLEDTISMTLDEYVESRDVDEAIECIKELNYPSLYGKIICTIVNKSFEKRDKEKEAILELLNAIITTQMFIPEHFKEGLRDVLDSIEDIEIDFPNASKFLAQVIGVCIESELFPLTYLVDAYIDLVDSGKAETMLKETFFAIENQSDSDRLVELYEKTENLDILQLFRPKNRTTQYLQEEFFQEYFPYLSSNKVTSDQSEPTLAEHLLFEQKAEGNWELNSKLAGVISVPLSVLDNTENSDGLSLSHPKIWATCIAYSFIQINFTEEQEDLDLIKQKTIDWLNSEYESENPPSQPLENILKKAKRLISEY